MTAARYAVAGWPVRHSRSPAMHNAAFRAAGIDAEYGVLEVPPGGWEEAMRGLGGDVRGLNVTHPHKESAWAWCRARGELGEAAAALRAVNTVSIGADGRVRGDNTDALGFASALREAFPGLDLRGADAVVLGGGGAARAAAWALSREGARVTMCVRRAEQGEQARAAVEGLSVAPFGGAGARAAAAGLVVNATPVGMREGDGSPVGAEAFREGQCAMDLIYAPSETAFLQTARAAGARTANGLPLLLHQAVKSWEIWTGRPAPEAAMRAALGGS